MNEGVNERPRCGLSRHLEEEEALFGVRVYNVRHAEVSAGVEGVCQDWSPVDQGQGNVRCRNHVIGRVRRAARAAEHKRPVRQSSRGDLRARGACLDAQSSIGGERGKVPGQTGAGGRRSDACE